jgi:hypothetical protein
VNSSNLSPYSKEPMEGFLGYENICELHEQPEAVLPMMCAQCLNIHTQDRVVKAKWGVDGPAEDCGTSPCSSGLYVPSIIDLLRAARRFCHSEP